MFKSKFIIPIIVSFLFIQCTFELGSGSGAKDISELVVFTVPGQIAPHSDIKSIQFYNASNTQSAPIIELRSGERLELRFDAITDNSEQYRLEFSHHDKDWRQSILLPENYLSGQQQIFITGGRRNLLNRPRYFSYSTQFPDQNFSFIVSGNYMLHVYDNNTNEELFSLPFFIKENEGNIRSNVEKLYNRGARGRAQHQLFSEYDYPDFIQFPQFDLKFAFAQNQLWGTTQYPSIFSTIGNGEIEFHQSRDEAYPADFEFNSVDLTRLELDGINILDYDQTTFPPKVRLLEDVQNFASDTIRTIQNRFGRIDGSRDAKYVDAEFSFVPRQAYSPLRDYYLVGDFNQWTIQPEMKLTYDSLSGWWGTTYRLKQGTYSYKYISIDKGRVAFTSTEDGFNRRRQEYHSFVYYFDPNRQIDRLLQINSFTSD